VWPVSTLPKEKKNPARIYHDLTEDLTSKKRYTEAGHVLLDYAEDVREAVIALAQGNQFSEARRIVSSSPIRFSLSRSQHTT
jgi:hypothetical protein